MSIAILDRLVNLLKNTTAGPLANDFRPGVGNIVRQKITALSIEATYPAWSGDKSANSSLHVVRNEPDCARLGGAVGLPRTFSTNGKSLALDTTGISKRRES